MTFLASIGLPQIPSRADLAPFSAEMWLIATILAVLLTPFFTRRSNAACAVVSLIGLALALINLTMLRWNASIAGFRFPVVGASHMLVSDQVAVLFKCLLLLFTIGVILMWIATTSSAMHEGDGPEFFTLLLGATLGMCFMASTSNLLMIFIAVEMASLPSYVLAGFRKTDRLGSEASLKYVLFGAATSSIMVYGLSMLYGMYGTLQVEQLAGQIANSGANVPLCIAIAGILIGIGFKISAVPLHFWCPDVFEGAGVDVSAFLSVASKGAGLVLLMRILLSIANGLSFQGPTLVAIAGVVGVIGAITATVGNTAALVQNNIKRLLAYSSIAHAGYMLCALSLLINPTGKKVDNLHAVPQALLVYLAVYLFMNLGAFTIAGLIHRATGSEDINDYGSMGRRAPVLAGSMVIIMFSLVGLPPFAGFIAKLQVMFALGAAGGWWWWLVAVVGVNSIISLYYYARVVRVMYLQESDKPALEVNPLGAFVAAGCAFMLVAMMIGWGPLVRLTTDYSRLQMPDSKTAVAPAAPSATPTKVSDAR